MLKLAPDVLPTILMLNSACIENSAEKFNVSPLEKSTPTGLLCEKDSDIVKFPKFFWAC